jgi:hypothetical protein
MINSVVLITGITLTLVIIYLFYRQRPIGRLIRLKISMWINLFTASLVIMMLKLKRLF